MAEDTTTAPVAQPAKSKVAVLLARVQELEAANAALAATVDDAATLVTATPEAAPPSVVQELLARVQDLEAELAKPPVATAGTEPRPPAPAEDTEKVQALKVHIADLEQKLADATRPGQAGAEPKEAPVVKAANPEDAISESIKNLGAGTIAIVREEGAQLIDRLLGATVESLRRMQAGDKKK